MTEAAALSPNEIVEIAKRLGVTRGSLTAQLRMAEKEGELDEEPTLNALRALLDILERAEGA
jgi:DNA-binding MarR family transcriptional regulator